jgi:pimeloyl-ACP methyl ester carboxylesterase
MTKNFCRWLIPKQKQPCRTLLNVLPASCRKIWARTVGETPSARFEDSAEQPNISTIRLLGKWGDGPTNKCNILLCARCRWLHLAAMSAVADSFDSAGIKIHYAVRGAGETVILIHGLHSSSRINWDLPGTTRMLAGHLQVVTMDCRGHGQSDKPEAEDAYGINMVEDVVRLMDHLGIQKARLVGYSMGAMIAMKLAVTHPDRAEGIILGGMGWNKTGAPLKSAVESVPKFLFQAPPACAKSFPQFGVTVAELQAVRIPVAVIIGENDPYIEWYVEPLRQVRPDWPVHIIAKANHLNCVGKPQFKTQLQAAL